MVRNGGTCRTQQDSCNYVRNMVKIVSHSTRSHKRTVSPRHHTCHEGQKSSLCPSHTGTTSGAFNILTASSRRSTLTTRNYIHMYTTEPKAAEQKPYQERHTTKRQRRMTRGKRIHGFANVFNGCFAGFCLRGKSTKTIKVGSFPRYINLEELCAQFI